MSQAQNTPKPNPNQELTLQDLADKIDALSKEVKTFDEKFGNYQQATQWVVQLAFALITSATITIIITSVLNSTS